MAKARGRNGSAKVQTQITVCDVCCAEVHLTTDGRVGVHLDGIGEECPMSRREAKHWDERSTRACVSHRSGGICEYCQAARATDKHHRVSRGVGGPWCPSNIVDLCRGCHSYVTAEPDWGKANGLIVKHTIDPETVLVYRKDGTAFQPTNAVTTAGDRA